MHMKKFYVSFRNQDLAYFPDTPNISMTMSSRWLGADYARMESAPDDGGRGFRDTRNSGEYAFEAETQVINCHHN